MISFCLFVRLVWLLLVATFRVKALTIEAEDLRSSSLRLKQELLARDKDVQISRTELESLAQEHDILKKR